VKKTGEGLAFPEPDNQVLGGRDWDVIEVVEPLSPDVGIGNSYEVSGLGLSP